MMNDTSKLPISRINELTETLNDLTNNIINVNDKFNRNYGMVKLDTGSQISSSNSQIVKEITITTKGRPVFLTTSGDNNPTNTSWCQIKFFREDIELCYQICVGAGESINNPFSMQYLDIVPAGTYTYKVIYKIGNGTVNFTEDNNTKQTPQFIVFEI